MYYFFVFLAVGLLSVGLILLRNPFFSFAYATSQLLNSMLESKADETYKQKQLLRSLRNMLPKFAWVLFLVFLVVLLAMVPVILYTKVQKVAFDDVDTSSVFFFISLALGSLVLFIKPGKKQEDYSPWSKLFHRMILDNYNISATLLRMEKRRYRKKLGKRESAPVIVTGLARGGTTALTNLLFEAGNFHSLSYSNMPFLLAVNTWRKIYHPRKNKMKERSHGDNILFGYGTIEALEEYFFKVFLKDKFISGEKLSIHEIDKDIYKNYLSYQSLVGIEDEKNTYLAKNNNLILRYHSLRAFDPDMRIVLIFRAPIAHAYSLLNQHNRFIRIQKENPFALEYMNWLGHHEFGMNHKVFDLEEINKRKDYSQQSINYWLAIWVSYYNHVLSILKDSNLFLIDYSDLCNKPADLVKVLGESLNKELKSEGRKPYQERGLVELDADPELLRKADSIYEKLQSQKLEVF